MKLGQQQHPGDSQQQQRQAHVVLHCGDTASRVLVAPPTHRHVDGRAPPTTSSLVASTIAVDRALSLTAKIRASGG
ncbi:hypothetical protein HPB47_020936 [Ixodes persulcatus]|uniref:Uncharacterized protein n=1 Tax=Ixodes persulcatus TaxID=34615 RepID=A0AC60QHK9_IXOPE|nr:hypothetical protein HPB47_020936 [Ixodes persulcatus]